MEHGMMHFSNLKLGTFYKVGCSNYRFLYNNTLAHVEAHQRGIL